MNKKLNAILHRLKQGAGGGKRTGPKEKTVRLFQRKLNDQLRERCDQLECTVLDLKQMKDTLEDDVDSLTSQYDKLKRTKRLEEEEIAHKIKMREDTNDIQKQKDIDAILRTADERVGKVKDEYRDKIEEQLGRRGDELKTMYSEILARLPEVTVKLGETTVKRSKK